MHIVGPQGSGKSSLIRRIVATAPGSLVHCEMDMALYLTNQALRTQCAYAAAVFVESEELGPRHIDLQPGDKVLVLMQAEEAISAG